MKVELRGEINPNLSEVEQLLVNRGIEYDQIEDYMNTSDNDIQSFLDLNNIREAVNLVNKHIKKNNRLLIQVDSDVDGFTSAALLYNYLRENYEGCRIDYQVHDQKRHGLDMVDSIYQNKYDLIIVPDAGSNEYEKHKELKELNIDVLVLDHHESPYESKDALVVNNQLSKDYKNKELSGVGVVWQFCRALEHFSIEKPKREADNYLDLVALGLIADMMDLRSFETRRLVEKGLKQINGHGRKNFFIQEMKDRQAYSLGEEVTPIGVAFYLAPMINAVVRVGTHEERIATFECFLDEMALDKLPSTKRGAKEGDTEVRVEQGVRVMNNIRNRQKREEEKGTETFGKDINQEYLDNNSLIILDTGGAVVKDLNGLIANQMQSKYKRPALVLREIDGYIEGSGRGHETNIMQDFRQFIEDSGYAEFAAGHPNAFGVRFTKENFEKFVKYSNEKLDYGNAHKNQVVDFIKDAEELNQIDLLKVANLESYWGTGMEEPYYLIKNIKVGAEDITMMRGNTMKIMVGDIPCIKFRASDELLEKIAPKSEYEYSIIDIVGRPNLNRFNGRTTGQIFITDIKKKDTKINF